MMIQIPKEFIMLGKKQELKRKCNFNIYIVEADPRSDKWFKVTSMKRKKDKTEIHIHGVRYDELEGQPTCDCEWGAKCISSGDFSKDCWHIRVVREMLSEGKTE